MGIITKEVEVIPSGKNISHYRDKGYDVQWRVPLMVKVEDLPRYSKIKIFVLCDLCKEHVMHVSYDNYNSVIEKNGSYVCKDCAPKKRKQTVQEKYNVNHVSQLESVKKKKKETTLKHYGTEHPLQNETIKKRATETIKARYGVEHALENKELKAKAKATTYMRYGVENAMQNLEVRQKLNKSLCKNGTQKTSKQQLYIHFLFGGELNYPISYYATDICFPKEKLCVEYDGRGHRLRVELGLLTDKEFDKKELVRDKVIKQEGYKIMRIISSTDKLPSDEILLQMLEHAKQYFSNYPKHSWIEFNIDSSTVRDAEQKEGSYFNYGDLRRIKKSDIKEQSEITNCA